MISEKCSCGASLNGVNYSTISYHMHSSAHFGDPAKELVLSNTSHFWRWWVLTKSEWMQIEKNHGNVRYFKINGKTLYVADTLTYAANSARKLNPFPAIARAYVTEQGNGFFPWYEKNSELLPLEVRFRCMQELAESDSMRRDFEENSYEIASDKQIHKKARREVLGRLEDFYDEALRANHYTLTKGKKNDASFRKFKEIPECIPRFELMRRVMEFLSIFHPKSPSVWLTTHTLALFCAEVAHVSPFGRNDLSTFEPWFERLLVELVEKKLVKPVGAMVPYPSIAEWNYIGISAKTHHASLVSPIAWFEHFVMSQRLEVNSETVYVVPPAPWNPFFDKVKELRLLFINPAEVEFIKDFCENRRNLAYQLKPIPAHNQLEIQ